MKEVCEALGGRSGGGRLQYASRFEYAAPCSARLESYEATLDADGLAHGMDGFQLEFPKEGFKTICRASSRALLCSANVLMIIRESMGVDDPIGGCTTVSGYACLSCCVRMRHVCLKVVVRMQKMNCAYGGPYGHLCRV